MAPSLKSPATLRSNTPNSNKRRQSAPIIPAIPRSLERRPSKTAHKPASPLVEVDSNVELPNTAATTQKQDLVKGGMETLAVKEDPVAIEDDYVEKEHPEAQAESPESDAEPEEEVAEVEIVVDNKDYTSSGIQEFEMEKHGFKLPPPFSPKKSPPAAISTNLPIEGQIDTSQEGSQSPGYDAGNEKEQQWDTTRNLLISSSAVSTFHAHPTPPSEITDTTSPTASSSRCNNLAQSFAFPQPTPPTDVTPSPTQPAYQQFPHQAYGHAHNISFHAPPPLSSNDTASPTRSAYHDPAYQHASYLQSYHTHGYLPQDAHADTQPPHFPQHRASDSVLQGQGYGQQTSYGRPFVVPAQATQPPFPPSEVPFQSFPHHMNGYPPPAPWEHGYLLPDDSLANPDALHHPISPSTLKADRIVAAPGETADRIRRSSLEDSIETNPWRSGSSNASRQVSASGINDKNFLCQHLLKNFNNEEFADCHFIIVHADGRFQPQRWSLNSLMIAQSARLRQLLREIRPPENGKRIIALGFQSRFMTPESTEAALRFCYGEPVTLFTSAMPHERAEISNEVLSSLRMKHCLDYAGSGCLLQLTSVMRRGLEVASNILNWENLEIAISFGLESVQEQEENASAAIIDPAIEPNIHVAFGADRNYLFYDGDRRPSSCVLFTPPSQKGHYTVSELSPPDGETRPPIRSTYDFFKHCLSFIKENFPTDWQLDVKARPLGDMDRLPATEEKRSPLSSSRLGHIQFGQMPSEAERNSSNPGVLISTIVLSITFPWLDFMVKAMGEPIRRNLESIVKERERRRCATLQSRYVKMKKRMVFDASHWSEASFEESVQTSETGELTLSRRYAGVGCDPGYGRVPEALMNIGDE